MGPKLKPKNGGPMDKFVKKKTDNQNGESSQTPKQSKCQPCDKLGTSPGFSTPLNQRQVGSATCPPLDKQEEAPHATHSFCWRWTDNKLRRITCNTAGTVEESLKTSSKFKRVANKNKNQELVILRYGKAITPHFPCSLIKNEKREDVKFIRVMYVKACVKPRGSVDPKRKGPSGKPLMFHLQTKGGKNVRRIMRNPALQKKCSEVTVYAFKGETVKRALRRDGRFLDVIFKKNCVLSNQSDEDESALSNLVDDLNGKTFQVMSTSDPPEIQSSLEDADVMQNESQETDTDRNQDPPQQFTATQSVNGNTPTETPTLTFNIVCEIPDSKKVRVNLSSQFKEYLKGMKTERGAQLSPVQNIFRVEYGKNAQTCREVKTLEKLMGFSKSVCQVRIDGRALGSGFLLFDKFVLTNAHVIKNVYNESIGQLLQKVTVHFSFKDLKQMEQGQDSGAEVEGVVGFEYGPDVESQMYDWALLRLADVQDLPDGLLTRFGVLPQNGGICIIGHPDGGVKRIDPCLIVPTENRIQVVGRHYKENPGKVRFEGSDYGLEPGPIQMVSPRFFEGVAKCIEQKRRSLNYETCFGGGSSGSPVFDDHCNVVAMHSGGYEYGNARGQRLSVIEFGYPLSAIIEHIIVQMVVRRRYDVLKKYLACSYEQHQNMMTDLKRLVESRNITAFEVAANNSEVTGDESLKQFFTFICHKENLTPMDID